MNCILIFFMQSLVLSWAFKLKWNRNLFTVNLAKPRRITHESEATPFLRQIETHFNKKMLNTKVPLLYNFTSYSKSLPVRKYNKEFLQLFTLSYYARPKDLSSMAIAISDNAKNRDEVRYISAPSGSGKTASVLQAFLYGQDIVNNPTDYFYLAFTNNDKRSFSSIGDPNSEDEIAEAQGAAFIFECVKTLLERPDEIESYKIKIEETPKLYKQQIVDVMDRYIVEKLGVGRRIWFHVDEHGKMCRRSSDTIGNGAAFSRGAMSTLAELKDAQVIATYIERPKSIPVITNSSGVCRIPIALSPIDVKQVMANVTELSIDVSKFRRYKDKMRLFTSLMVRLAFKLRELNVDSVIHRRGSQEDTENFLKDFNKAKNKKKNSLKECNTLCAFPFLKKTKGNMDDFAAELLVGISDDDSFNRQFSDVVSLPGGLYTVSIERLMKTFDPKVEVYNKGANLFRKTLNTADLFSSTPLEASYYWSLSCSSALFGTIDFSNDASFSITCKDLLPGRLFTTSNSSIYDLNFLKQDILYYVNERDGKDMHPLADLFFITRNMELVLVDITGRKAQHVSKKMNNILEWIEKEQSNIKDYRLRGVVLAPNVDKLSKTVNGTTVSVVIGEPALQHLGGLRQIAIWSEEP